MARTFLHDMIERRGSLRNEGNVSDKGASHIKYSVLSSSDKTVN